jgi:hypothetical protein
MMAAVVRSKAEEYRRRAQKCLDFARGVSLETHRTVVIDMAQDWLRLAEKQEAQEETVRSLVPEQPQAAAQQQQQVQPKDDDKKE